MLASGLSSHRPQPSHDALAGGDGAADDENGIITADRAEDVRPGLAIERRGNRLGATGHGTKDQH